MNDEYTLLDKWEMVHQKVAELSLKYLFYVRLYREQDTVDRMNRVAPSAFSFIQDTFANEFVRILSIITDRPRIGKNENITLLRVIEDYEKQYPKSDKIESFRNQLKKLQKCVQPIRDYRNKIHSHIDFETATGENTVAPVQTDDIDKTVKAVWHLMSELRLAIDGETNMAYDWSQTGNAEGTIEWMLKDSERLTKLRDFVRRNVITDEQLRELVKNRSDRADASILGE